MIAALLALLISLCHTGGPSAALPDIMGGHPSVAQPLIHIGGPS